MNTEMLMQYITYALAGVGILAFFVSVVVQVIKEIPILKKIQTNWSWNCQIPFCDFVLPINQPIGWT